MSIQSEINRITNEVNTQESLILQIQEALKDTTIVKGGPCILYVNIGASSVKAEGVIVTTD